MDMMRYAFYIAIFNTMRCIVPSLLCVFAVVKVGFERWNYGEPIMRVWGQRPQRGQGAEQSPPEAESYLAFKRPKST